jgi:hypothetical protein
MYQPGMREKKPIPGIGHYMLKANTRPTLVKKPLEKPKPMLKNFLSLKLKSRNIHYETEVHTAVILHS